MFKRILLFVLTNVLVVVTLSIVLNLLGVRPYLTANGIDYQSLLIFCLVWGFGGAFISLALSRFMAKMMLGVKVIDPRSPGELQWLYNMVEQTAKAAGLPVTPEVGVYQSPEVNAFATGPTQNRALVAYSTGLLSKLNREQIEGVTGHEIAHIKNGDMVTMTLLQGVVNAFVMFIARVIAFAVGQTVKDEQRYMVQFLVTIVLEILLSILGSIVVMWFSRQREFRADRGAAQMVGAGKMISALEELGRFGKMPQVGQAHESLNTLKIAGKTQGWLHLFASHPPLNERIRRLQSFGASPQSWSLAS